ncbi:MAG TPA: hypothetical protein VKH35_09790, partial [Thermoanaerobaculia bacterium]|nr:hypothetical protein [Thermoanaerobaculia bacterium]
MPHLLSRLAAICREHLLREKILVVPSLAVGHQIADAVAHGGTPWVNLRVETLRTISDAVAGFDLAREGVTVLSRAQALAMIERACDRVLDESSYFGALADRPGLHRAIQKSIDDLRHASIDTFPPSAFEVRRKANDIARILRAYEAEMHDGRYIDRFGVLRRAVDMLERGAPRPWSPDAIWIVVEDVELTAAEERLLKLAAGEYELLSAADEGAKPDHVDVKRAVGEENELRAAFRAILDEKLPFDDAEIVYTTRDPYLPLAYELASEYEIPCTFAEGIAAPFTRPGQACLAFLRWIGDGWHALDLQRAARAGAFAGPSFARALRRARIGWGRDRYSRIDPKDEEAAAIVKELLEISEPDIGLARSASRFVAKFAHVRNEIDAMAREALRRMLDELAEVESISDAKTAAARLAEAVSNLHVAASNPRPGFLHVAPVRAGGWSARSRLFIAGLDESKHPGSGLQDPIILDVEREAIGIPIVGDRPQRTTEQFQRLLARAAHRRVTLSYASLSLGDRREQYPSRPLHGQPAAPAGFVDPTPLNGSQWWLLRRFADGDRDIRAAVLAAYPGLHAGASAEAARDSDAITKWDGRIDAPPELLDPRRNGIVYSASQLEKMAGCPY